MNFRALLFLPIVALATCRVSAQVLDVTFPETDALTTPFRSDGRTYLEFLSNAALGNPTEPVNSLRRAIPDFSSDRSDYSHLAQPRFNFLELYDPIGSPFVPHAD